MRRANFWTGFWVVVLVLVFMAFCTPRVRGQEASESELAPIPNAFFKLGYGVGVFCKPYFILAPSRGATGARSIIYNYRMPMEGMDGFSINPVSKLETVVDDKKKVPTVQVLHGDDPEKMRIILRISGADYRAAAVCLPKPGKR